MKGERTVKRASFGHAAARKALSDITNSPPRAGAPRGGGGGKQLQLSPAAKDYVNQLLEVRCISLMMAESLCCPCSLDFFPRRAANFFGLWSDWSSLGVSKLNQEKMALIKVIEERKYPAIYYSRSSFILRVCSLLRCE